MGVHGIIHCNHTLVNSYTDKNRSHTLRSRVHLVELVTMMASKIFLKYQIAVFNYQDAVNSRKSFIAGFG